MYNVVVACEVVFTIYSKLSNINVLIFIIYYDIINIYVVNH